MSHSHLGFSSLTIASLKTQACSLDLNANQSQAKLPLEKSCEAINSTTTTFAALKLPGNNKNLFRVDELSFIAKVTL